MAPRHAAVLVLAGACALCIFFLAPPPAALAYDCTTNNSGNWRDKSVWEYCGNSYPSTADTATINFGNTVTVDHDAEVAGLSVYGVVDLSANLAVQNGPVTIPGSVTGEGTLRTLGTTSFSCSSGGLSAAWVVDEGTTSASGAASGPVTVGSSGILDVPYDSALYLYGAATVYGALTGDKTASYLNFDGPTFTNYGAVSVATVTWGGSGTQISGYGTWNGSAFDVASSGSPTLASDISLSYSTYTNDGTLDLGGWWLTVSGGTVNNYGTLNVGGSDLVVSGGTLNNYGTITRGGEASGEVETSGAVSLAAGTFYASLWVRDGTTTASGTIEYDARVDDDATLSVAAGSSLTVVDNLTVDDFGTVSGVDGGSTLHLEGPILTNRNLISVANVTFDGNWQALGGGGTWTGAGSFSIESMTTVTLEAGVILSYASYTNYGVLNLGTNNLEVSGGTFTNSGDVAGTGEFRTSDTVSLVPGTFYPPLHRLSGGATTTSGTLSGAVTVDGGGTLIVAASSSLDVLGDLTAYGYLGGADDSSTLVFNGANFYGWASVPNVTFGGGTQNVTSSGTWTGAGAFTIGGGATVVLANAASLSYGSYTNYGTLDISTYNLTITNGSFTNYGAIYGSGEFRTSGSLGLYPGIFYPPLRVLDGTTTAAGSFDGPVTVDASGTLRPDNGIDVYGNLTVNGTLGGAGTGLDFYGAAFTNGGTVSVDGLRFRLSGTQTIGGAGTWNGTTEFLIEAGTTVALANSVDLSYGYYANSGALNLGSHTLTASGGTVDNYGSVSGTGTFRTTGTTLFYGGSSGFVAAWEVYGGTTTAYGRVDGPVTVSTGATLWVAASNTLTVGGNLTVNGALGGADTASLLVFSGAIFTNNGVISVASVTFSGPGQHNLVANAGIDFTNLAVAADAILVETVAADNVTATTLTNHGTIIKAKPIEGTGAVIFGLTGVTLNVTTQGALTSLQVDRTDSPHPNATVGVQTGRWWRLTPNSGAAGYTIALTLPHNNLSDPTACMFTGDSWDCARWSFAETSVKRSAITNLFQGSLGYSDWAVGNDIRPAVAPVVGISKSDLNVDLSWSDNAANAEGYIVCYAALPAIDCGESVDLPAGSTGWTHNGAAGGPAHAYYYGVGGRNGAGNCSDWNNITGVFSFSLTPGAP